MTVVVTGASGMLGGAIYRRLLAAGVPVEGWSAKTRRSPDGLEFRPGGIASRLKSDVDLVVHCAAMTDADDCEKHPGLANYINGVWTGELALAAADAGAHFIYVSTDAVYNGESAGLRREDEAPSPTSAYARSKLFGEQRATTVHPKALIVRTTMVGWALPGRREKFAEQIIRALVLGRPLRLWGDAVFSPLHVEDLGEILLGLAEGSYTGVLNVGARDAVSKANFGRMIATAVGGDETLIEETSVDDAELLAPRTKNTALDVSRATDLLGPLPLVRASVDRLSWEISDGTVERLKGGSWPT